MNFGQNIHNINHLENNEFIDKNDINIKNDIDIKNDNTPLKLLHSLSL